MNHDEDDHARMRELLGPYILGGLEAPDRIRLDRHLRDCAPCRDEGASYAGLPALLRPGRPQPILATLEDDVARDNGLAAAVTVLRGVRRRRRNVMLSAAAVLVVGVGATTLKTMDDNGPVPTTADRVELAPPPGSTSRGVSTLEDRPWGTSIDLDLRGLPDNEQFVAWVVAADGEPQQAATWSSTSDGAARVTGASALSFDEVSEISVTTTEGEVVLASTR